MTYRDPDGWYLPSRLPQHAAPFGFARPFRQQAHLALRLFVTVGTWAAGLCLVVGSIVLVTNAAAKSSANPTSAQQGVKTQKVSGGGTSTSGHLARSNFSRAIADSAVPQAAAIAVVKEFRGRGNRAPTVAFHVRAGLRWALRWSYSCPAHIASDRFSVTPEGGRLYGLAIDESGTQGQGVIWLAPGGATHRLAISSTCSWSVQVTQAR